MCGCCEEGHTEQVTYLCGMMQVCIYVCVCVCVCVCARACVRACV